MAAIVSGVGEVRVSDRRTVIQVLDAAAESLSPAPGGSAVHVYRVPLRREQLVEAARNLGREVHLTLVVAPASLDYRSLQLVGVSAEPPYATVMRAGAVYEVPLRLEHVSADFVDLYEAVELLIKYRAAGAAERPV